MNDEDEPMYASPLPTLAPLDGTEDIAGIVGDNLRRLRTRNGLSLERLAKSSGVSRAMLSQIELGRSAPTVNVLWKIARALGVPFTAFTSPGSAGGAQVLRAHRARWLNSRNGRFAVRALFPTDLPHRNEFYELRLAAQTAEESDAHPAGTTENLVVAQGVLEVGVGAELHRLNAGDALHFIADLPHVYRNPGQGETVAYLVMAQPNDQLK
jgi:transcriptional regulator with XRE-family HTH domain